MMQIADKYAPQQIESKWYDYWMEHRLFHSEPDEREPYTIVIPPPNVTGMLHMGHMLNNTLQDVLVRRARMQGKNACWVPGTDHASIATEAKGVAKLKAEGIEKSSLSREEFLRHAWDWKMDSFVEETVKELKERIGNGKVLCALSGGVDSSVCAAMLAKAIGKQLTCVFVDHGLLRKNEREEVCSVFGEGGLFDINFVCVDARERFYSKLAGVTAPEAKRKIIGEEFIRVFEEEAQKIGAVDYLAQGTIYPDVVESGLGGESATIKSHHNVGGLPDFVDFKEIVEPLRDLFKDEVRKAGLELGIPENLVFRQPFPGPGLAIRIIGEVTAEKVAIVQDADYIYREEVDKLPLAERPSQYFAALTNMRSVGVMGDERTYDYAIALRAVTTTDFMTAEVTMLPPATITTAANRIVNEVKHINRVLFDYTTKPPATIEFE